MGYGVHGFLEGVGAHSSIRRRKSPVLKHGIAKQICGCHRHHHAVVCKRFLKLFDTAVALAWALRHRREVAGVVTLAGASMPWTGGLGAWYGIASRPLIGPLASRAVAGLLPRSRVRTLLGAFLFTGDDVDKSVSMAYGAVDGPDASHPSRISYLIDAEGRIAKVYGKVVPADHPAEVLADLG